MLTEKSISGLTELQSKSARTNTVADINCRIGHELLKFSTANFCAIWYMTHYRVAVWIGYYWILSVYFEIYDKNVWRLWQVLWRYKI